MKLEVIKREIGTITVTDDEVLVSLELGISHGAVKKSVTPITVEHSVRIEDGILGLGNDEDTGIADAVVMAMAGVNKRADETIAAMRGLTSL